MKDRNECCEHEGINFKLIFLEKWLNKLDNRLWFILVLLFVNSVGIIGILLTALLTT